MPVHGRPPETGSTQDPLTMAERGIASTKAIRRTSLYGATRSATYAISSSAISSSRIGLCSRRREEARQAADLVGLLPPRQIRTFGVVTRQTATPVRRMCSAPAVWLIAFATLAPVRILGVRADVQPIGPLRLRAEAENTK